MTLIKNLKSDILIIDISDLRFYVFDNTVLSYPSQLPYAD
jgi:hypothetical protein